MAILYSYSQLRRRFYKGSEPTPTRDNDGYPTWPLDELGVLTGLTMPTNPATVTFPLSITVNSGAADAALYVDEYDWYLSQRTDVEANQYMLATQFVATNPTANSYSSTMSIALTALGAATFPNLTPDELFALTKNVHIYCQRKSDDAIAVGNLGASLFAG